MIAEGAFPSRNPRVTLLAGSVAFRAGPDGLTVGRFGWGDTVTGLVNNSRGKPTDLLGFVLPYVPGNSAMRVRAAQLQAVPGVGVTLTSAGDFLARFMGGAWPGARVYASLVDGSAISGEAADAEPTPWYVVNEAAPGGLAIISTYSKVTT